MNRFVQKKNCFHLNNLWISLLLFLLILGIFYFAISSFSAKTDAEQLKSLEETIQQSIVQCYCVEGSYPESLAYLEENYGIAYNKEKFLVDYQTIGKNMMPDITILMKP